MHYKTFRTFMILLSATGMLASAALPAYADESVVSSSSQISSSEPTVTPAPTEAPTVTPAPTEVPTVTPAPTEAPTPTPAEPQQQPSKQDSSSSSENADTSDNESTSVDQNAGNVIVDPVANETEVFRILTGSLGLNRAAAAGLMGNFYHECGFNQTAVGGGGISYGLAQWTGSNYSLLTSWCSANGQNYRTVEGQLAFLKHDLETRFPSVYAYLKAEPETADGAYDAAYYFCSNYERPLYITQQSITRGNTARTTYWERYKDSALGSSGNINDYMNWLSDYVADNSHGFSSVNNTNNPDVDECSLIWYALYENGYLVGENKYKPFNFDTIESVLTSHGFEEQTDVEEDLSKLEYGDIIVNADRSGASIYEGNGKMYLAQQTEINKANGEKAGDQGKEVFLGHMMKGISRKVFRLKEKDSLPSYAEAAIKESGREDFLSVDKISKPLDEETDSTSYIAKLLNDAGILDSADATYVSLPDILQAKGFTDVSAAVLAGTDTVKAGDILHDIRHGTGIALAHGYVFYISSTNGHSRMIIEKMGSTAWRQILRPASETENSN